MYCSEKTKSIIIVVVVVAVAVVVVLLLLFIIIIIIISFLSYALRSKIAWTRWSIWSPVGPDLS